VRAGCASPQGCGRVMERHPGVGLVKVDKWYACYLCVVMPQKFPQSTRSHEAAGKFSVPDATKKKKVPTVGRIHPSKRKAKT
jgi:hypothetical protein